MGGIFSFASIQQDWSAYIQWIIWFVGSILSILVFIPFFHSSTAGMFSRTLDAINIIAMVFIIGIPFSFGSALLVRANKEGSNKINLRQYGIVYMICSLFIVGAGLFTAISFGVPLDHLPGILLAALVVAMIPCIFTTVIAQYFDDWRYSLLISSSIFLFASNQFGYLPQHMMMGTSSLYSLYHLYRFLAVLMSGYQFETLSQMENTLGLGFDIYIVVNPLFVWILFAILSFLIHRFRVMKTTEYEGLNDIPESSPQMLPTIVSKKYIVGAMLTLLVILSGASYAWNISPPITNEPETFVLYSSHTTGETLVLGQWWTAAVEFPDILKNSRGSYTIRIEVLQFGFEDMTLSEFAAMNESQRDDEFSGQHIGLGTDQPTLRTGWSAMSFNETRLWVHRMTSQSGNQDGAEFIANIVISARAES
ncbi:MAG: hypothetical protein ACW99G_14215 [Candidatus Thorarchaeota archaeon]